MSTGILLAALTLISLTPLPLAASAREDAETAIRAKDYARAFKLFEKAAKDGDAAAQFRLGNAYVNGGIANKDPRIAADWYQKSAMQGYAPAETMLGRLALRRKEYGRALGWFQSAAAKGDAQAEDLLGYFYLFGRGVAKDPVKAAKLFGDAAAKGNPDAQFESGILLLNGLGFPKDATKGLRSIHLAAAAGNPNARRFLKVVAERRAQARILAPSLRVYLREYKRTLVLAALFTLVVLAAVAAIYRNKKVPTAFGGPLVV